MNLRLREEMLWQELEYADNGVHSFNRVRCAEAVYAAIDRGTPTEDIAHFLDIPYEEVVEAILAVERLNEASSQLKKFREEQSRVRRGIK